MTALDWRTQYEKPRAKKMADRAKGRTIGLPGNISGRNEGQMCCNIPEDEEVEFPVSNEVGGGAVVQNESEKNENNPEDCRGDVGSAEHDTFSNDSSIDRMCTEIYYRLKGKFYKILG